MRSATIAEEERRASVACRDKTIFVGVCLLALLSAGGAGAKHPPRWTAGLGIEEAYNDNIQQAPSGEAQDDFITNFDAYLGLEDAPVRALQTGLGVRGHVYAEHPKYDYAEILPDIRYSLGRVEPFVQYLFSPRRLLFADEDGTGDAFYADHVGAVGLRTKLGGAKQLRTRLAFEIEGQEYRDGFEDHNSTTPAFRMGLRYFAWPWLVPIFDFQYAVRSARRDNYDRDEIEVGIGAESALADWLTLRFRYKSEWRTYTVARPRTASGSNNGNFGRNDDIEQVETWLVMPVRRFPGLAVGLRHRYRNGDSNRSDRRYDLHEVGIGLSYALTSEWSWD